MPDKFASYVPVPEPVSSDYYIACHYYPGWKTRENGYSGFEKIVDFPERTPIIGYYDEADPEVSDWQVKWAREHGINCFVYCWYRGWATFGKPMTGDNAPSLAHQLDALFSSRYGDLMDFAIMWECDNAAPADGENDLIENLLPFWAEKYFSRPNYLKIDNKPVLFVYDYSFRVAEYMGGEDKVRTALEKCREKIKDYGFDGIIFQVEYRYDDFSVMQKYKDSGYDAIFSYCWHTNVNLPTQEEAIDTQISLMQSHIDFDPNMAIMTCSQSWDPYPWNRGSEKRMRDIGMIRWKLTPDNWRILLEKVKSLADSLPENALGRRFIMLDNWNEWGEGHYIAPHLAGGFKYLQAVREVFTKRDNLPDYRLPEQLGLGPYDTKINLSAVRDEGVKNMKKEVKDYIISIPDFPEKGIIFRDITGVLQDADGLQLAIDELAKKLDGVEFDAIAGAESRGFIFGAPLAYKLKKPFLLIRKKGKLPRETVSKKYDLEYGTAEIEIHKDAIKPGQRIVLIDDLIATGGTMKAAVELVEELGGKVVKLIFLVELAGLNGRELLKGYDIDSVVRYEGK